MCRHLGYLGPAVGVGDILTRGTHSLVVQSWAPSDMRCSAVANADGFGVAWWPGSDDVAGSKDATSHRSVAPIWSDPSVTDVLPHTRSRAVLGAVRSATSGMPITHTACAPFVDGRWAFSHNGVVADWPASLATLAADVPVTDLLRLPAATDSAGLWLIVKHLLRSRSPAEVLRRVIEDLDTTGPGSRLNLMLCDGTTIWATAVHHSLSTLIGDDEVLVASEPLDDDPRWTPVPDRSIVTATRSALTVESL